MWRFSVFFLRFFFEHTTSRLYFLSSLNNISNLKRHTCPSDFTISSTVDTD